MLALAPIKVPFPPKHAPNASAHAWYKHIRAAVPTSLCVSTTTPFESTNISCVSTTVSGKSCTNLRYVSTSGGGRLVLGTRC
eukprot:353382-Rhodomonas_salina.1